MCEFVPRISRLRMTFSAPHSSPADGPLFAVFALSPSPLSSSFLMPQSEFCAFLKKIFASQKNIVFPEKLMEDFLILCGNFVSVASDN